MEEQHQNPSKIVKEWLEQMGKLQWDPWPEEQIKPYFEKHVGNEEDTEDLVKIDPTIEDAKYSYKGQKDDDGEPHFYGTLTYENGKGSVSKKEYLCNQCMGICLRT